MRLRHTPEKLESRSDLGAQGQSAIASDVESTAFLRTVRREGCDHRVPLGQHSPIQQRHVRRAIYRISQKVKYRAVMPDIESTEIGTGGNIGHHPLDQACPGSQFLPEDTQSAQLKNAMPELKLLSSGELEESQIKLSQTGRERRCTGVDASREAVAEMNSGEARPDIETVFRAQYDRIARVIARVLRDPARAEELAVEVFLKWSRTPQAQGENSEAWLYRVAVRTGLDELRRETRRSRLGHLLRFAAHSPTPEEVRASREDQEKVRAVLAVIQPRQAELLVLRSQGLSYDELASALDLKSSSIGTFLNRAEQAFRKEYIQRYGYE